MIVDNKTLKILRTSVQNYFPDVVSAYAITVTHARYGRDILASGLVFTVSGQLSAPTGREREIITALKKEGVLDESTMKLALPYGIALTTDHVVVTSGGVEWDVVFVGAQTFTAATEALLQRKVVKANGSS